MLKFDPGESFEVGERKANEQLAALARFVELFEERCYRVPVHWQPRRPGELRLGIMGRREELEALAREAGLDALPSGVTVVE